MAITHYLLKPFKKVVIGFGKQSEHKRKFVAWSAGNSVHGPKPVLDMIPDSAVVEMVPEYECKALGTLFM